MKKVIRRIIIILNKNIIVKFRIFKLKYCFVFFKIIGDWGLGIGDWGLAQSPIPNPQSPIPTHTHKIKILKIKNINFTAYHFE
jgi:hypothetical protein